MHQNYEDSIRFTFYVLSRSEEVRSCLFTQLRDDILNISRNILTFEVFYV